MSHVISYLSQFYWLKTLVAQWIIYDILYNCNKRHEIKDKLKAKTAINKEKKF